MDDKQEFQVYMVLEEQARDLMDYMSTLKGCSCYITDTCYAVDSKGTLKEQKNPKDSSGVLLRLVKFEFDPHKIKNPLGAGRKPGTPGKWERLHRSDLTVGQVLDYMKPDESGKKPSQRKAAAHFGFSLHTFQRYLEAAKDKGRDAIF